MKKTLLKKADTVFPNLILVILAVSANLLSYFIPQLINLFRTTVPMESPLDGMIPLIPVFVISYVGAYFQWVVYYIRIAAGERATAERFLSAEILTKFICLICFILIPVTMERPVIEVRGVFSWACSVIYAADRPVCLFPSIHCIQSWMCMRYMMASREPSFYKVLCILFSVSVFLSTVLIKQHLIADVISGIAVAEVCLFIAGRSRLPEKAGRFVGKLRKAAGLDD